MIEIERDRERDISREIERDRERERLSLSAFLKTSGPHKPYNHNLYVGIIVFPHIDNPQSTGYDKPEKKNNKGKKGGPH